MWLPPAYRRARSAFQWRMLLLVWVVGALVLAVAAVTRGNGYQLILAGVFALNAVFSLAALRAQRPS